jgi:hypothetical protein
MWLFHSHIHTVHIFTLPNSFICLVRRDSVVSHVHWLHKLMVSLCVISSYSVLKICTLLCHVHMLRRRRVNVAILSRNSHCCSADRIEKNEMGGACGKNGGEKRCVQGLGEET